MNASRTFKDPVSYIRGAMTYYREALEIDPGFADARYNLELARRFLNNLKGQNVQLQRNPEAQEQRLTPSQGAPHDLQAQSEGTRDRDADVDEEQAPQGAEAQQGPQGIQSSQNRAQTQQGATPQALSPEQAEEMVEIIRGRAMAVESQRQQWRQATMREGASDKPW